MGLFLEGRLYFIFETLILGGSIWFWYGSAVMFKIEVRVFNWAPEGLTFYDKMFDIFKCDHCGKVLSQSSGLYEWWYIIHSWEIVNFGYNVMI